jgi:hypothetical protein
MTFNGHVACISMASEMNALLQASIKSHFYFFSFVRIFICIMYGFSVPSIVLL